MPKKCESCRFYLNVTFGVRGEFCTNAAVGNLPAEWLFPKLTEAREICDREGDGHFVYFEPRTPAAGTFVQITREKTADNYRRVCSCLGTCRGAESLGPNYACALKSRGFAVAAGGAR